MGQKPYNESLFDLFGPKNGRKFLVNVALSFKCNWSIHHVINNKCWQSHNVMNYLSAPNFKSLQVDFKLNKVNPLVVCIVKYTHFVCKYTIRSFKSALLTCLIKFCPTVSLPELVPTSLCSEKERWTTTQTETAGKLQRSLSEKFQMTSR